MEELLKDPVIYGALQAFLVGAIGALAAVFYALGKRIVRLLEDQGESKLKDNAAAFGRSVVLDDPNRPARLDEIPAVIAAAQRYALQEAPRRAETVTGRSVVARVGIEGLQTAEAVERAIVAGERMA